MNEHRRGKPYALLSPACQAAIVAAQKASAPSTDQGVLEEVTVTGSRIRRTDGMAEPTPVTTLTPQDLLDDDPPVVRSNPFFAGAAQVVSNTHEIWGRRYQLGFSIDL